jgi:hypothetical protein
VWSEDGNVIDLADLVNGMHSGEAFTENLQDKQQTVSGVRDNDVGKNGMCVTAALAGEPKDTQIRFLPVPAGKIGNRSAVVGMNAAVSA